VLRVWDQDLKNILKNLNELKPRIRDAFEEAEDRLEQNRFLVKLKNDINITVEPEDLKKGKADLMSLKVKFEELGFKSLLKEIGKVKSVEKD